MLVGGELTVNYAYSLNWRRRLEEKGASHNLPLHQGVGGHGQAMAAATPHLELELGLEVDEG
jgi:hypothetical protein